MAQTSSSRRERPAKPALSRQWIIAETIEIMRSEGLEKATMRRVAQALDTGPASLYVYIANTAELHSAVLDELLGALWREPAIDGAWNDRLETLLRQYTELLFAYPGLARSALVSRPSGPNAVQLYDRILALLLEGDVAADRASWGVDLLLQHVTGIAAEHSATAPGDTAPGEKVPGDKAPGDKALADDAGMSSLARALHAADPATAPHVARHVDAILSGEPSQRVTWAIQALIAGLAATPIP